MKLNREKISNILLRGICFWVKIHKFCAWVFARIFGAYFCPVYHSERLTSLKYFHLIFNHNAMQSNVDPMQSFVVANLCPFKGYSVNWRLRKSATLESGDLFKKCSHLAGHSATLEFGDYTKNYRGNWACANPKMSLLEKDLLVTIALWGKQSLAPLSDKWTRFLLL